MISWLEWEGDGRGRKVWVNGCEWEDGKMWGERRGGALHDEG